MLIITSHLIFLTKIYLQVLFVLKKKKEELSLTFKTIIFGNKKIAP